MVAMRATTDRLSGTSNGRAVNDFRSSLASLGWGHGGLPNGRVRFSKPRPANDDKRARYFAPPTRHGQVALDRRREIFKLGKRQPPTIARRPPMSPALPATAQVVIIGGGAVGCSLAYHLAELGWQDIVLVERKRLTSGTTWHAAGLIGQLRASQNMTKLAQYSATFFGRLQDEMGHPIGFKRHGSLSLAGNRERLEELHRGASMARVFGLEVRPVTPEEIGALYP